MNPRPMDKADAMAVAGLICGIIGCITMCIGISAIFFGALAIFFGLLARGDSIRLTTPKNRAALILGVVAIVAGCAILGRSWFVLITEYGSLENAVNEFWKIYDASYDRIYNSLY